MKYGGMNSPMNSNITNPIKNGDRIKKLKEHHTRQLGNSGVKPPRSPIK